MTFPGSGRIPRSGFFLLFFFQTPTTPNSSAYPYPQRIYKSRKRKYYYLSSRACNQRKETARTASFCTTSDAAILFSFFFYSLLLFIFSSCFVLFPLSPSFLTKHWPVFTSSSVRFLQFWRAKCHQQQQQRHYTSASGTAASGSR